MGVEVIIPGSGGTNIGRNATDKLGFFGVTPVVRQSFTATVTTTQTTTTLKTDLAAVVTALENLGLLN